MTDQTFDTLDILLSPQRNSFVYCALAGYQAYQLLAHFDARLLSERLTSAKSVNPPSASACLERRRLSRAGLIQKPMHADRRYWCRATIRRQNRPICR